MRTSLHLFGVFVDVVGTNGPQETNVVVAMVTGHLLVSSWVWSLCEGGMQLHTLYTQTMCMYSGDFKSLGCAHVYTMSCIHVCTLYVSSCLLSKECTLFEGKIYRKYSISCACPNNSASLT